MRILIALSLALSLGLIWTPAAEAQQRSHAEDGHSLSVGAMDAAVASRASAADRHRTQLAELLATPEVRELAGEQGIDMERVESTADGLSESEMAGLAPLVSKASAALRTELGTVTISVGAIIIILLILILVS
ncbi:MAG: hypothetical protein WD960_08840 [Gemmatimonadota bacterium]